MLNEEQYNYIFKIFERTKTLKNGETREIECPKCKAKMTISKANNGHLWAICENDKCIRIFQ